MPQHHKYAEERNSQRAVVASDLLAALEHLQHAHAINRQFALDLELPSERLIADAISACATTHRKENEEHERAD